MRTLVTKPSSWVLILLALVCTPALRAQLAINWFTVDGGGGTSGGGDYVVSGTIGQPDAGATMSGGGFSVSGGFWGFVAVTPTPGAPMLTVWKTATNTVVISWPSPSSGYVLNQNTDLNSMNWTAVGLAPADDGTTRSVTVNPPVGNTYYRLQKP